MNIKKLTGIAALVAATNFGCTTQEQTEAHSIVREEPSLRFQTQDGSLLYRTDDAFVHESMNGDKPVTTTYTQGEVIRSVGNSESSLFQGAEARIQYQLAEIVHQSLDQSYQDQFAENNMLVRTRLDDLKDTYDFKVEIIDEMRLTDHIAMDGQYIKK